MTSEILLALGGIGLFLLGMLIMTEGLKELAGESMRRILARFTTNTVTGAAAGATTTAIIQSSSATTITAIGFVGAGMMTFPQALSIIFGANIGTTITGWIVAMVGFKLNLGTAGLPLLLLGVLLKMFGHGKTRPVGWALVGFSLLFIGIDIMQDGLATFEGKVTPENFPSDTMAGRLQLVLIGVAITLITQSSSAGIATAMMALAADTISFPQAAAMVIGMDVGTTFKAYLATIGGSTAMRQTGYAHIIYNMMTGVMAFFLVGFYTAWVQPLVMAGNPGDAQVALVAFHTSFNTLGVILVLPFAGQFARLIMVLVPEKELELTERLDEGLIEDAPAAIDAVTATVRDIAIALFEILEDLLDPDLRDDDEQNRLNDIELALDETHEYLNKIQTDPSQTIAHSRHVSMFHAVDHLTRLYDRCRKSEPLDVRRQDARLQRLAKILAHEAKGLHGKNFTKENENRLSRVRSLFRRQRKSYRRILIIGASKDHLDPEQTADRLDSIRWMHRSAYHVWRIIHHLRRSVGVSVKPAIRAETETKSLEI